MVFELLGIAAVPTATGLASGISSKDQSESHHGEDQRMKKFNLRCYCTPNTPSARRINDGNVVLRNGKLYIVPRNKKIEGHLFEGFYIAYPDPDRPQRPPMGLVSSISNEPTLLNWIYMDKMTRELKYGNRTQCREHIVGSWDWVSSDEEDPGGLVLAEEEAAVAVQTAEGSWEVKWADKDGTWGTVGKQTVEVSLERILLPSTIQKPGMQHKASLTRDLSSRTNSHGPVKHGAAEPVRGKGRRKRQGKKSSKEKPQAVKILEKNKETTSSGPKPPP